jgi:hypothetical protein
MKLFVAVIDVNCNNDGHRRVRASKLSDIPESGIFASARFISDNEVFGNKSALLTVHNMTQVTTSLSIARKRDRGPHENGKDTVEAMTGRQEFRNRQMNHSRTGGETIPPLTVAADKGQSAIFGGLKFVIDHHVWLRDRRLATENVIKVS